MIKDFTDGIIKKLEEYGQKENIEISGICGIHETTLTAYTGDYVLIMKLESEKAEYTVFSRMEWFLEKEKDIYYRSIINQVLQYEKGETQISRKLGFVINKDFNRNDSIITVDKAIDLYIEKLKVNRDSLLFKNVAEEFKEKYSGCIIKVGNMEMIQLYDIAYILAI